MKISKDTKSKILDDKDRLSIKQIAKKYNLTGAEVAKIIKDPSKKNSLWFYTILVLIPVMIIVLLEVFLRTIDYGYDLDQWLDAGQGKYIINPNIGRRYFPSGDFTPNTIEDVFDQQKKTNSFRVFVLGGSSAQGFPFNPMGSFSRYIRKRLELAYPETKIEVVNIGMTAVNSYTVLDLLPGVLDQDPDLILVYAGHNEYYGALGVGSVQSFGSSQTLINLVLYLNSFKVTQLVRNSINSISSLFISGGSASSGTLMSRMAKEKYILLNSEVFNSGIQQFQKNLTDILQLVKDKGISIVLGKLVSNLKDQKPFISVNTPNYKTADQVFSEAEVELNEENYLKADSLFRLAKELDALRFRAPQEMNDMIDDLSQKFNIATVQIDAIFDTASPDGIVGDNLIVDHLHPNVEGYQLMGKAFYDTMEKHGYLPGFENAKIPFNEQDSLTRVNFVFTKLDSVMGEYNIKLLKSDWPYVKERVAISEFQSEDFAELFQPKDFIDSLAMLRIENKVSWIDAHLVAATYNLRHDKLKEYLKYMNVLIYQYPSLRDLDGALKFFHEQRKINLADYTPKRNGLLALYIGNFDNAIRYLSEAYKLNPGDPLVLFNLSLAYLNKNNYDSALTFINKCLDSNPDYPEAQSLKKRILNEINN